MDPIEVCEKVAQGLFQAAAEMRELGVSDVGCGPEQLDLLADSIESDRDESGMQAIAQAIWAACQP